MSGELHSVLTCVGTEPYLSLYKRIFHRGWGGRGGETALIYTLKYYLDGFTGSSHLLVKMFEE